MVIKGDDLWTKVHHLIADSVEAPGATWVRTTGLDEAWNVSFRLPRCGLHASGCDTC